MPSGLLSLGKLAISAWCALCQEANRRILGNVYSRVFGGTAFTSMVTGVLFLVPVSLYLDPYTVSCDGYGRIIV